MDEDRTGTIGDLLAGLSVLRGASVPEPGPALRELFAATAPDRAVAPPAVPAPSPRRDPVHKRILTGLPSKVAAGTLGFLLAGTLGAGALTGTIVLASDGEDVPAGVVSEDEVEVVEDVVDEGSDQGDGEATEDGATGAEDDEAGANDAAGDVDPAAVPVPASVSEAAQTHDFDEVCGNHGMYVSSFAQLGEEAPCAADARTAVDGDGSGNGDETAEQKDARAEARSERQSAKAGTRSEPRTITKSGKGGR